MHPVPDGKADVTDKTVRAQGQPRQKSSAVSDRRDSWTDTTSALSMVGCRLSCRRTSPKSRIDPPRLPCTPSLTAKADVTDETVRAQGQPRQKSSAVSDRRNSFTGTTHALAPVGCRCVGRPSSPNSRIDPPVCGVWPCCREGTRAVLDAQGSLSLRSTWHHTGQTRRRSKAIRVY